MRDLMILSWFFIFLLGGAISYASGDSPKKMHGAYLINCDEPITWKIGQVDSRFNISREKVKKIMVDVSKLWSAALGKELISYRDSSDVDINLIYGKQQEITDNEQKLLHRIERMKLQHYALEQDYERLFNRHSKELVIYNDSLSEYINKVSKYNRILSRHEDTGVIPREENEQILELKKQIITLERELKKKQDDLNSNVKNLKKLSRRLHSISDQVNRLIFSYNDKFKSQRTFYQGVYIDDPNHKKINIYEFENIERLKLVLAHEVGHALGLGHVKNPKSIMYYLMEQQQVGDLQLSEQDIQALEKLCVAKTS